MLKWKWDSKGGRWRKDDRDDKDDEEDEEEDEKNQDFLLYEILNSRLTIIFPIVDFLKAVLLIRVISNLDEIFQCPEFHLTKENSSDDSLIV